jgi:hypothetical protein
MSTFNINDLTQYPPRSSRSRLTTFDLLELDDPVTFGGKA